MVLVVLFDISLDYGGVSQLECAHKKDVILSESVQTFLEAQEHVQNLEDIHTSSFAIQFVQQMHQCLPPRRVALSLYRGEML